MRRSSFFQLVEREGVDDVFFFQPAFAGDARAEAEKTGVLEAVGVAVDDALDAFGFRVGPEPPVHVEPVGIGVQLDPGAGFGAGVDDGLLVDLVRLAFEEQAAGEMAEDVDEGILRGADDARGVVGFIRGKTGVKAGDDDVEFGEQVVVEIELVLEDVHLGAGQQTEINALVGEPLVDFFDFA